MKIEFELDVVHSKKLEALSEISGQEPVEVVRHLLERDVDALFTEMQSLIGF